MWLCIYVFDNANSESCEKKNTYTGQKKFQLHPNNNNNSTIETPMVPHIGCTTTLERVNTYKCNK